MTTKATAVTGSAIKRAIETRDSRMLSGFYAENAQLNVIDRNNPPSRPRIVRGRAAISTFWDDICSRTMTHKVDTPALPTASTSSSAKTAPIPTA